MSQDLKARLDLINRNAAVQSRNARTRYRDFVFIFATEDEPDQEELSAVLVNAGRTIEDFKKDVELLAKRFAAARVLSGEDEELQDLQEKEQEAKLKRDKFTDRRQEIENLRVEFEMNERERLAAEHHYQSSKSFVNDLKFRAETFLRDTADSMCGSDSKQLDPLRINLWQDSIRKKHARFR